MRRVAVGNFAGAKKLWQISSASPAELTQYETRCICALKDDHAVKIGEVVAFIEGVSR